MIYTVHCNVLWALIVIRIQQYLFLTIIILCTCCDLWLPSALSSEYINILLGIASSVGNSESCIDNHNSINNLYNYNVRD